jgi:hypothetical protein
LKSKWGQRRADQEAAGRHAAAVVGRRRDKEVVLPLGAGNYNCGMLVVSFLWVFVLSLAILYNLGLLAYIILPKANKWQFSLRSLLITTTAIAVLLGLIAAKFSGKN